MDLGTYVLLRILSNCLFRVSSILAVAVASLVTLQLSWFLVLVFFSLLLLSFVVACITATSIQTTTTTHNEEA